MNMQRMFEGVVMILSGAMVVAYYVLDVLPMFIYPLYIPLVVGSALFLIVIGILLLWKNQSHISCGSVAIFSQKQNLILLLIPVFIAWFVKPMPLSSHTANNRGVGTYMSELSTETAPSFLMADEDRSLLDWVRLMQLRPEPEEYIGRNVIVEGQVVYDEKNEMFMLVRFVIACCAADGRPVGLYVHNNDNVDFVEDSWVQVNGVFSEGSVDGQRRAIIDAVQWQVIPTPNRPYEYL